MPHNCKPRPASTTRFLGASCNIGAMGPSKRKVDFDRPPRKLKSSRLRNGYHVIVLCNDKGHLSQRVHRVVCQAFHGPPPSKAHQASHLDDNKENNTPSNLAWETGKENMDRRIVNGIDDCGHRNKRALLDEVQIKEMKRLLSLAEYTHKEIGEMFGVSRVFVTKVANGHRYAR